MQIADDLASQYPEIIDVAPECLLGKAGGCQIFEEGSEAGDEFLCWRGMLSARRGSLRMRRESGEHVRRRLRRPGFWMLPDRDVPSLRLPPE